MCHPGDNEYMPVNKTWGIIPPSGMRPSAFSFLIVLTFTCYSNRLLLQLETVYKLHLNSGAFWRKFSKKTKLSERTWAKLVNLDTLF